MIIWIIDCRRILYVTVIDWIKTVKRFTCRFASSAIPNILTILGNLYFSFHILLIFSLNFFLLIGNQPNFRFTAILKSANVYSYIDNGFGVVHELYIPLNYIRVINFFFKKKKPTVYGFNLEYVVTILIGNRVWICYVMRKLFHVPYNSCALERPLI